MKLLMNAIISGLSTALGTTFGSVLDNDAYPTCQKRMSGCIRLPGHHNGILCGIDFFQVFRIATSITSALITAGDSYNSVSDYNTAVIVMSLMMLAALIITILDKKKVSI